MQEISESCLGQWMSSESRGTKFIYDFLNLKRSVNREVINEGRGRNKTAILEMFEHAPDFRRKGARAEIFAKSSPAFSHSTSESSSNSPDRLSICHVVFSSRNLFKSL